MHTHTHTHKRAHTHTHTHTHTHRMLFTVLGMMCVVAAVVVAVELRQATLLLLVSRSLFVSCNARRNREASTKA
jgi:hypothetical protein